MKYVYIGKETVETYSDVYDLFDKAFRFPEYFGRNLDALHDCLTDAAKPELILIGDRDCLKERLGDWADAFFGMLEDSAEENENIRIREV